MGWRGLTDRKFGYGRKKKHRGSVGVVSVARRPAVMILVTGGLSTVYIQSCLALCAIIGRAAEVSLFLWHIRPCAKQRWLRGSSAHSTSMENNSSSTTSS